MNKRLHNCPVCNSRLEVTRYECPACEITIEGKFQLNDFASLSIEQQEFAKTFICCQGNIKEVERKLKISYPTVKNRLQQVVEILCGRKPGEREGSPDALGVLSELESGKLSVEEAIRQLRKE